MQSGVYVIRRVDTTDCYVGSSQNIGRRIRQHLSYLRRGAHDNPHLQLAWSKHGPAAFLFEIVDTCETAALYAREQHFIDTLRPSYNAAPCADSPMRGRVHTATSKAKMAAAHQHHPCMSAEGKAKLAEKLRGNKNALGCTRSPETPSPKPSLVCRTGSAGALLIVGTQDGATAHLAARINGNWRVAGGVGVPWTAPKQTTFFVAIEGIW